MKKMLLKKTLLLGAALISVSAVTPALAQTSDDGKAVVGATAGGATGGTIGFLLGGPIGAVVGGWAGAVIGAEAAVPETSIRYVGEHPVDPVRVSGNLAVGYKVTNEIKVYPIEGDDRYGYFYANGRVWIVDLETNEVVQSPGYAIRQADVDYVRANRVDNVNFSGELVVGTRLDGDLTIAEIPEDSDFSYVYVNDRPVLVDRSSRVVLWIGE